VKRLSLTVVLQIAVASLLAAEPALGPRFLAGEISAAEARFQERSRMHDDLLLRVERMAPGFGGMFIDPNGRLAVYLLDPSQLSAARSAIEAVFGPGLTAHGGVRALQGQYTVSQLKAWTERANAILEVPGVTMVDLDEGKNRVTVGVEDDSRTQAVKQVLSSLKIPREAIVIQVTGQIRRVDPR